jgi:hypothetical protein
MVSAPPSHSSGPPEQAQVTTREIISPRTLHRAEAIEALKTTCRLQEQHKQMNQDPQTPQDRHRELVAEWSRKDTITRGAMSSDGSSVRLPSGQSFSIKNETQMSSDNEVTSFNQILDPFNLSGSRRTSASTVLVRRQGEDRDTSSSATDGSDSVQDLETEFSLPLNYGRTATYVHSDISEAISPSSHFMPQNRTPDLLGSGRKRAREVLGGVTNELHDGHPSPQKRPRLPHKNDSPSTEDGDETSTFDRLPSPTPQCRKALLRKGSFTRRVQSQPEFRHTRRESIENGDTLYRRQLPGRRTWSAGEVLSALNSGREDASSGEDMTPPRSPLGLVSTLPTQGRLYTLQLPKACPKKLRREPLSNITNQYVPKFLQDSEPAIRIEERPPTPGGTWNGLLDSIHTDEYFGGDDILVGFDGVLDKKLLSAEASTSLPSFTATKDEHSDNEDKTKAPILAHVIRGLDNDASFLQDALQQIKTLKARVRAHERRRKRAKQWLDNNQITVSSFPYLDLTVNGLI